MRIFSHDLLISAKLKGEMDSNRETYKNSSVIIYILQLLEKILLNLSLINVSIDLSRNKYNIGVRLWFIVVWQVLKLRTIVDGNVLTLVQTSMSVVHNFIRLDFSGSFKFCTVEHTG